MIVGTMLAAGCFADPEGLGIIHVDGIEITRVSDLVLDVEYTMYNLGKTEAFEIVLHFEAFAYADEASANRGITLDQSSEARLMFDEPLPGGTHRTINYTVDLSELDEGWKFARQFVRVEYDYDNGGQPAATYGGACFSRDRLDTREYCEPSYSMWRRNVRDPLPGSPYWQEQLRSAGFEPGEPTA